MDITKIFNLFPDENSNDEEYSQELEAYKKSQTFKVKMFIKLMMNGEVFVKEMDKLFRSSPQLEHDDGKVAEYGYRLMYVRAYYWICEMDPTKFNEINWDIINKSEMKLCLFKILSYYEGIEEFEKCSKIKEILDLSQNN